MKQVKHAIVAMLDNPQSKVKASSPTSHHPSSGPSSNSLTSSSQQPPSPNTHPNSQPSPPGTSNLPIHPPRPRKGPSSSQSPGLQSQYFPRTPPAPVYSQSATSELYQYAFPPLRPSITNSPYPPQPHQYAYAPSHPLPPPIFQNTQPPRPSFQPSMYNFTSRQRLTPPATRFGPHGNRAYASVVRGTPTMYGRCCEYCGEPNHRAHTCRHGI
nr:uncharacterized protein LOC129266940 [Lytechinus pictus]